MARLAFGPNYEEVTVMGRKVYGPNFPNVTVDGGAPAPLPDLTLNPVGCTGNVCTVNVPDHDPTQVNVPVNVYAVYAPGPAADGQSAADFLAAAQYQASVPVSGAGDLAITVPGVPPGTYFVQTILEFPDPAGTTPAPTPAEPAPQATRKTAKP